MSNDFTQAICHECDLLVDLPAAQYGHSAYCPRCRYRLTKHISNIQSKLFCFSFSALVFLLLSMIFPFLTFSAKGQERTITLLESIEILIDENFTTLAIIVFSFPILAPTILLIATLYISFSILTQSITPATLPRIRHATNTIFFISPWCMAEIFLIGILVSFIKITAYADIILQLSFWTFCLFNICLVITVLHLDKKTLWQAIGPCK